MVADAMTAPGRPGIGRYPYTEITSSPAKIIASANGCAYLSRTPWPTISLDDDVVGTQSAVRTAIWDPPVC